MEKRVLVRVDFNVPMSKENEGEITDDKRIVESVPTIKKIINDGGRAILMSHMGRPKGEKNLKYSLRPVAMHLTQILDKPVLFAADCIAAGSRLDYCIDQPVQTQNESSPPARPCLI